MTSTITHVVVGNLVTMWLQFTLPLLQGQSFSVIVDTKSFFVHVTKDRISTTVVLLYI
jgi:hypothetical protein